jgi:toxin YoeB
MGKYNLIYSEEYDADIGKIVSSGQKIVFNKIKTLEKELAEHPREGTGKPKRLKGFPDKDRWSRRITDKHRLVYDIKDDIVVVLLISAYGHYDDE